MARLLALASIIRALDSTFRQLAFLPLLLRELSKLGLQRA